MALAYRTRRTFVNALLRAVREPRQLVALLIIVIYGFASLAMIIALLVLPIPPGVRALLESLIPGGLAAGLDGVRGALTFALLLLACTAAFQNPLLQFGQVEIDLLFPAPIPAWRLLLDRVLLNHLRALVAGYFFWGLAVAPLLRIADLPLWPAGGAAVLALAFLFASVDQGAAAALFWLEERGRRRWLVRLGMFAVLLLSLLLIGAALGRLVTGDWSWLAGLAAVAGSGVAGVVLFPIGLANNVLLDAPAGGAWLPALAALLLLDLATAGALLAAGATHMREVALAAVARSSPLLDAIIRARFNPVRLVRALWNPDEEHETERRAPPGVRPFGAGAWALAWARLVELQRGWLRNSLAIGALGVLPLLLVLRRDAYSLGGLVTAAVFSASLGTQLFNDLSDHITRADIHLALPVRRWRLLVAELAVRLPVYWAGGIVMLIGVGLLQEGARWGDIAALTLWYPLLLLPLVTLRGALMFLYPAAALPGRRDPVQAAVVMLINGVLTMALLFLSLTPLAVLLALVSAFGIGAGWFWPVVYLCSALLALLGALALAWAYGRFEPTAE